MSTGRHAWTTGPFAEVVGGRAAGAAAGEQAAVDRRPHRRSGRRRRQPAPRRPGTARGHLALARSHDAAAVGDPDGLLLGARPRRQSPVALGTATARAAEGQHLRPQRRPPGTRAAGSSAHGRSRARRAPRRIAGGATQPGRNEPSGGQPGAVDSVCSRLFNLVIRRPPRTGQRTKTRCAGHRSGARRRSARTTGSAVWS
ncbi:hypothetical protein HBB16_05455 [Pseudonocardia sp. MCCB 268]|nr:hypothetical protein [Pseudonocardia cytotoxica]